MIRTFGEAIAAYAQTHGGNLMRTSWFEYQPNASPMSRTYYGVLNPAVQIDFSLTGAALAAQFNARYGYGSGIPYKTDPENPGSVIGSPDANRWSWTLYDASAMPSPEFLVSIGLPPGYQMTAQDM